MIELLVEKLETKKLTLIMKEIKMQFEALKFKQKDKGNKLTPFYHLILPQFHLPK